MLIVTRIHSAYNYVHLMKTEPVVEGGSIHCLAAVFVRQLSKIASVSGYSKRSLRGFE